MNRTRYIRKKSSSEDSAFTVQQGVLMAAFFIALATTLQATQPGWWTTTGGPLNSHAANDYMAANQGQLKQFTQKAVQYLDTNLPGGAGVALDGMVTGWSNYYATNGYSSTNPAPADFKAVNQGQLKYVASLVYGQLASAGYTGLTPSWITMNTNTDYMVANAGQLKSVFNFDLSVAPPAATNLLASTNSPGEIDLSWTLPAVNNATSITIQRSFDGGVTWTTLGTPVDPTITSYQDIYASPPSGSVQYRVVLNNPVGSSAPIALASPAPAPPPPQTPTGFTGIMDPNGYMNLSWPTGPWESSTTYHILRQAINGSVTTLTPIVSGTYTDNTRSDYLGYRYQLVASTVTGSATSAAFPQPHYAIVDLGPIVPYAINNSGMVAFDGGVWANGTITLPPVEFTMTGAGGISEDGYVVGHMTGIPSYVGDLVISWSGGIYDLKKAAMWSPSGIPLATSSDTTAVISTYVFYEAGQIECQGTAISPAGKAAGTIHADPLVRSGDFSDPSSLTWAAGGGGGGEGIILYPPFAITAGGTLNATPAAINDSNVLITATGYVSAAGIYTTLSFTPNDINNGGMIVGGFTTSGTTVTTTGKMYKISTAVTTSLGRFAATKINNASPAQVLDNGDHFWTADSSGTYHPINVPDYLPDSDWTISSLTSMNDSGAIAGTATASGSAPFTSVGGSNYLNSVLDPSNPAPTPAAGSHGTLLIPLQLRLLNGNTADFDGTVITNIIPSPENPKYDNDVGVSGGLTSLGVAPMGEGVLGLNGYTYSCLTMVAAKAPASISGIQYRWKRYLLSRSWYIQKQTTGGTITWYVTQRERRGTDALPADDTGGSSESNVTPATSKMEFYTFDYSGFSYGANNNDTASGFMHVGDFIHTEKAFTYKVQISVDGTNWTDGPSLPIAQSITVKYQATGGTAVTDLVGVPSLAGGNTVTVGTIIPKIDPTKVRAIVGSSGTINIDSTANN